MFDGTITMRKAVPIVVVTWILSLITTLVFVYADPSLFNLQVNQNEHEIKIVRFYEPYEKNVTGMGWDIFPTPNLTEFVWTPSNPTNNAILEVYVYLEYYHENPPQFWWDTLYPFWWKLEFAVSINEFYSPITQSYIEKHASNQTMWEQMGSFKWTQACLKVEPFRGLWVVPNQNNYTLTFGVSHTDYAGAWVQTYLRNINVIIEVIDGIPVA